MDLASLWRSLRDKGFLHLLSVNVAGQALAFGTALLVARLLRPKEFGEIRILQTYVGIFAVFAGFGLNAAILRACSERRREEEFGGILRLGLQRAALAVAAVMAVLAALAWTGTVTASPALAGWLMVYALTIPFTVATDLLTVFLQARKRIQEMARAQLLIRAQSIVLVVAATWYAGFGGYVVAMIAAAAAGLLPVARQTGLGFLARPTAAPPAGFFATAALSVLGNGISLLGQSADIFILDHYCGQRDEIGYYSVAMVFFMGAMQVTGTAQSVATPYFSERAGDAAWFRRQLVLRQAQLAVLSVGVAAACYAGASLVIAVLYGGGYASARTYLGVLMLRYVLLSSSAVLGVALFGLGFVRYNLAVVAVTTPCGIVLTYVLLHHLGVAGVAWAQVASALLGLLLLLVFTRVALRAKFPPSRAAAR